MNAGIERVTARSLIRCSPDPFAFPYTISVKPRALTADDIRTGLLVYIVSSAVVLLAVWFGHRFVQQPQGWDDDHKDYLGALCRYDGNWYLGIVTEGYSYDPERPSNVAFFPAFPLAARGVVAATDCRPELATIFVAHFFLAMTLVLLHASIRVRATETSPGLVVLAMALFPTTFFFRLGYTESMFCFWCVLAVFGHQRGWHPGWIAAVAGVATATRAPGVALGFVVLLSLWQRSRTWGQLLAGGIWLGPLSCWGLFAFIGYQAWELGEPFGFVKTQQFWNSYPNKSFADGVQSLLTFEPIWATYDPASPRYWAGHDAANPTAFSLQVANPIYFVVAALAVAWGWWRRYLTPAEALVAAGLLVIPYGTRAYPNSMGSFGRFSAVVVPVYIVFGYWLGRLPTVGVGLVMAFAVSWLVAYAALFGAAWWLV